MTEFDTKQLRIQALLTGRQLDALLLQRVSSFAWATCGAASYVNTVATTGEATLHSQDLVQAGQVYAWNPSIAGTKSEDTILVGAAGPEVLTAIDGWPVLFKAVDDLEYARPAILEVL